MLLVGTVVLGTGCYNAGLVLSVSDFTTPESNLTSPMPLCQVTGVY